MRTHALLAALISTLVLSGTSCMQAQPTPDAQHKGIAVAERKQKGWLGVSVGNPKNESAKQTKQKGTAGALVEDVVDDSPAALAGIEEQDIILEFNGTTIADADDLVAAVRKTKPGETVPVVIQRNDQKKTLHVKVGKLPTTERSLAITIPPMPRIPRINVRVSHGAGTYGLQVMDLNSQLGEYFGAPYGKGVLVERVNGKSTAAKAGFKAGDVIVKVGKEEIGDTEDLFAALDEYTAGDTATVQIIRKGTSLSLALTIPEERGSLERFFRREYRDAPGEEGDSPSFWFYKDHLRQEMKNLQEQLRGMSQEIRTKVEGLRDKLERQLRQVGS
jgi:S1-C subfamily serine protease